jgi:hypothetical protein
VVALTVVVLMMLIAGIIKTGNLVLVFPILFFIYLLMDHEKKGKPDNSIDALFGLLFFLGLAGVLLRMLESLFR